ncbi:MAG: iron complex outermembrane receptor protein [Bermanella sp.]|jgi:iron complex outermembrane receptor protein
MSLRKSVSPTFALVLPLILTAVLPQESSRAYADAAKRGVLEEVVVTARRRAENLQDTPIAVSAFGADTLDQMGISDIEDVEMLAPSLQFSQNNYKAPAIFIRGIGQRSGSPALDPGVGMYLNGVYVPRSDAQLLDAVDVENIQVLRGPQGTLFGKNNIGGAILVDSKKPHSDAFEFAAKLTAGSYGRKDGKLSTNIPLTDDLALRLAVNAKRSDGSIDNVAASNSLFDQDRLAFSARTLWFPSEQMEVDLFGLLSRIDERGSPYNCKFQNNGAILTKGIYRDPNGSNLKAACDDSEQLAKSFEVSQNDEDARYAIDNHMLALTLRMPLFGMDLESISSYAMQDNIRISGDSDGTAIHVVQVGPDAGRQVYAGGGEQAPDEQRTQFTQELKFNGRAFDERVNYTFGVFYSKELLDNTLDGTDVGENGLVAVGPDAAVELGIPLPNNFVLPVQANAIQIGDYENETQAVFAQANWDVVDWLQFTFGFRYTQEQRSSEQVQISPDYIEYANRLNAQIGSNPAIVQPVVHYQDGIYSPVSQQQYFAYQAPQVPLAAAPAVRGDTKFSEVTPNLTLTYLAQDDTLEALNLNNFIVYATLSRGFKSGGLDLRSTQTEASILQFEPELVTNREMGFKLDAFDNRLRFNVAAFQMDYTDLQVALYERGATATEVIQFTGNAGEAVVEGFELEVTALLGDFTINANAGFVDGDLIEYDLGTNTVDGFVIVDRSGEAFPQVPQNVRGMVVRYDWYSALGIISPQIQYYYSDEIFIGADYLSSEFESSTLAQYELYNARVSWEINEQISMTAFADNLKNEPYFVGGIAVTSVIGVANRVPGTPRQFGLEFSYKLQ